MLYRAEENDDKKRLDVFLAERADMTRSRAEKLIRDGLAQVDGKIVEKPGLALRAGQAVELTVPEVKPSTVEAQDIPLEIVYQDDDLAVVYKPSGMVVHPAAGNPDGTMVNALLKRLDNLSGIGGEMRPGIVHRIDKDTSGLLLVAKNDRSHLILSEQIKAHTVERAYRAILIGRMKESEGDVSGPIGRHPTDRKKMAVTPKGSRSAVTHWEVIARYRGYTHIRCRLETGRTHQIRVHMAHIGHPLLGDGLYGAPCPDRGLTGQCLHARELKFIHPRTGEKTVISTDLPEYFTAILSSLPF